MGKKENKKKKKSLPSAICNELYDHLKDREKKKSGYSLWVKKTQTQKN